MDELARLPEVAECYGQWNELRDELERYYKDAPREHKPFSQQKEFKAIKNMVIREAEELRLGAFTFEDTTMKDEVDEDQEEVYYAWSSRWQMAEAYQNVKEILSVYENTEEEKAEQVRMLEQLWNAGFTVAAHLLNKCWRDSMGVLPDDEQAELWFRRAAEAGHDFSQYALGKLLQSQKLCRKEVQALYVRPWNIRKYRKPRPFPLPAAWHRELFGGSAPRRAPRNRAEDRSGEIPADPCLPLLQRHRTAPPGNWWFPGRWKEYTYPPSWLIHSFL